MTALHVLAVMIREHGKLSAVLRDLRAMRAQSGGHCGEEREEARMRHKGDEAVDAAIAALVKVQKS